MLLLAVCDSPDFRNSQPGGMEGIAWPGMLAEGVKFSLNLLKHDF